MIKNFFLNLSRHRILILIILVAIALRLVLVLKGGQFFLPDENRFKVGYQWIMLMRHGYHQFATILFFRTFAHPLYLVASVIIQFLLYFILKPFYPSMNIDTGFIFFKQGVYAAAFIFSLFSVVCIFLVYKISRRMGAEKREGLIAAFLMACSTSMFYYSRHIQPYDLSIVFALFSIWLGIKKKTALWMSFVCGLMSGVSLMVYYGYCILILVSLYFHVFAEAQTLLRRISKALVFCTGAVFIPLVINAFSLKLINQNFLIGVRNFSTTVLLGDYAEGWSPPWEYLWHIEHFILLLWASALIFIVGRRFLSKEPSAVLSRAIKFTVAVGMVYVILFVVCDVMHRFVIYGRTVRQMVPFFCLLTASAAEILLNAFQKLKVYLISFLISIVIIQAAFNSYIPFIQRFPKDIQEEVKKKYGPVFQFKTLNEVRFDSASPIISEDSNLFSRYVLLNADLFYRVLGRTPFPLPAGKVLFQERHPFEYLPYQYEEFIPSERKLLRQNNISMRLIEYRSTVIYLTTSKNIFEEFN